jgi:hypothetical protein
MADIDDIYVPPNADGYERREVRDGMPLEYVGEKLGLAVRAVHKQSRQSRQGEASSIDAASYGAFHYTVTAFVALYNMLGLVAEPDRIAQLLELDEDDFDAWVGNVEQQGSVTG